MILVVMALMVGMFGSVAQAQEKIKVGLSFSDFATERWKNEQVLMQALLEEKGYEVVWQEANHDVKLQNDQIENMVAQGAKAVIVVAEDGDAAATAADAAAEEGVLVIAYDRLIKSTSIAAYVSFNNVEVGRQQALGVLTARWAFRKKARAIGRLRTRSSWSSWAAAPPTTTPSCSARARTKFCSPMWMRA